MMHGQKNIKLCGYMFRQFYGHPQAIQKKCGRNPFFNSLYTYLNTTFNV